MEDDLVAGLYIQQERRHFQRVRAGGGQQDFLRPNELFKRGTAAPGKVAVARDVAAVDSRAHILELIAKERGFVEGDFAHSLLCSELSFPYLRKRGFTLKKTN
jgi:hypothetical protein